MEILMFLVITYEPIKNTEMLSTVRWRSESLLWVANFQEGFFFTKSVKNQKLIFSYVLYHNFTTNRGTDFLSISKWTSEYQ